MEDNMSNREIKFRVWDVPAHQYTDNYHITIDLNGSVYNLQNGAGGNDYILQQYTGMKDKNDIEIYEGDIVKFTEKLHEHGDIQTLVAEVIYDSKNAAFGVGKNNAVWNWFTDYGIANIEVIGNKFETPEKLLISKQPNL